jgi:hypothetical protein
MFRTGLALAFFAFTTTLFAADQFAGTWKLNPAESSGDAVPKDATLIIEDHGDTVHVTIVGTAADGTPIAVKYIMPVAGGTGQVTQGPYDSVSQSSTDANTHDVTYSKNGKEVSTDHEVVSKGGNTMTVTSKGQDAEGKPVTSTDTYQKQ